MCRAAGSHFFFVQPPSDGGTRSTALTKQGCASYRPLTWSCGGREHNCVGVKLTGYAPPARYRVLFRERDMQLETARPRTTSLETPRRYERAHREQNTLAVHTRPLGMAETHTQ